MVRRYRRWVVLSVEKRLSAGTSERKRNKRRKAKQLTQSSEKASQQARLFYEGCFALIVRRLDRETRSRAHRRGGCVRLDSRSIYRRARRESRQEFRACPSLPPENRCCGSGSAPPA